MTAFLYAAMCCMCVTLCDNIVTCLLLFVTTL